MKLFPYQEEAIEKVNAAWASGFRRVLLCLPTGSGKTLTTAAICNSFEGRILWITHRKELVEQPQKEMAKLGLRSDHIRFVTFQGLLASGERPECDLLVCDESRHGAAPIYSTILAAYPHIRHLLLDATPERQGGDGLGCIADKLIVGITVKELVALGRLAPIEVFSPTKPLRGNTIAQSPVDAYKSRTLGRQAVLFAASVQAAEVFSNEFTRAGVAAICVHGSLPVQEREERLAAYARGEYKVLTNVFVTTDGWDDPPTSVVILARGCSSGGTFLQMVGRMRRAYPGKTICTLLDLKGGSVVHGHPDEERIYSLEGRAIRRAAELASSSYCAVCGAIKTEQKCEICGIETESIGPPKVANKPLVARVYLPKATEEEKLKKLKELLVIQQTKSYKKGWVFFRFKLLFGHPPPSAYFKK